MAPDRSPPFLASAFIAHVSFSPTHRLSLFTLPTSRPIWLSPLHRRHHPSIPKASLAVPEPSTAGAPAKPVPTFPPSSAREAAIVHALTLISRVPKNRSPLTPSLQSHLNTLLLDTLNASLPALPWTNHTAHSKIRISLLRALTSLRGPLSPIPALASQYARARLSGPSPNPSWRAAPRDALRSHPSFAPLPPALGVTIASVRDLRRLRANSPAHTAAAAMAQVSADNVCSALGLVSVDARGAAVARARAPENFAARARKTESSDQRLRREFGEKQASGALLAFLTWENSAQEGGGAGEGVLGKWGNVVVRPGVSFNENVRVGEGGLFFLEERELPPEAGVEFDELPVLAASPAGVVKRRCGDAYGAWEKVASEIVIVRCAFPFEKSGDIWLFNFKRADQTASAAVFAEAQINMLCAGLHVRRASVVSYAVLGGLAVLRVERNDSWIEEALKVLQRFQMDVESIQLSSRHKPFTENCGRFLSRTESGAKAVRCETVLSAEFVNTVLIPKNDWERERYRRLLEPFIRDQRL